MIEEVSQKCKESQMILEKLLAKIVDLEQQLDEKEEEVQKYVRMNLSLLQNVRGYKRKSKELESSKETDQQIIKMQTKFLKNRKLSEKYEEYASKRMSQK